MAKKSKAAAKPLDTQIREEAAEREAELEAVAETHSEMERLEVLPGLFGQIVPDDRFDSPEIIPEHWPIIFAAAPMPGDLIRSIDGRITVEVTRRGHAFGPLGPYVIVFVKAFGE